MTGPHRSSQRPNIVLIHWHDVGRHLSPYGCSGVPSPHVEQLAEESTTFGRAFSTSPLCSPARGSLFTGRYPHENGLMGLAHLGWSYHPNERTLPHYLSELGYHNILVGLQHEATDATSIGYEEAQYLNAPRQYADAVEALASARLKELEHDSPERPFFLSVGFFEPHRPYPDYLYPPVDPGEVSVPGYLPDTPEVRKDFAAFYGAIRTADAATGRLLETLRSQPGLAENTWVLFTTDHGIAFPRAKSTLFDSGTEVALMVRPPGGRTTGPAWVDDLVSHVDVLPTLLELAGYERPIAPALSGSSFASVLTGTGSGPTRDRVFTEKSWHDPDQYDPVRAVRTDRHKLIVTFAEAAAWPLSGDLRDSGTVGAIEEHLGERRPAIQLYDLQADPWELHDVAQAPGYAAVRDQLLAELGLFLSDTQDPVLRGPVGRPIVPGSLPGALLGRHQEHLAVHNIDPLVDPGNGP